MHGCFGMRCCRSTSCSFGPWESAAAWFMLALGAYLTISGLIADSALL